MYKIIWLLLLSVLSYGNNVQLKNNINNNIKEIYKEFVKKNQDIIKKDLLLEELNNKIKSFSYSNINDSNIDKIIKNLNLDNVVFKEILNIKLVPENYLKIFEYSYKLKILKEKIIEKLKKTENELNILEKENENKNKTNVNIIDTKYKNILDIENNKLLKRLQYFYLIFKKELCEKLLIYIENKIKVLDNYLIENFEKFKVDKTVIKNLDKTINIYNKYLKDKINEYNKLYSNYQRWLILGQKQNQEIIKKYIQINLNKQVKYLKKILVIKLDKWLIYFKLHYKDININNLITKDKKLLIEAKKLDNILIKLKINNEYIYERTTKQVLKKYEKRFLGLKYYIYLLKTDNENIKTVIINILNYPLYEINKKPITPLKITLFFVFFIIGLIIGKYYKKTILKIRDKYNLNHSNTTIVANLGNYFIITLFFIIGLKTIGLDLTSLSIIIGALSVGIGFGLQTIISNFISGLILMFEKTLKIGDYIEVGNIRGTIKDISMRSMIIKTNDNIDIIIPNKNFIENNVINWTLGDKIVRFKIPFSVAYGTDIDEMEKILLENLEEIKKICPNIKLLKNHKYYDVEPKIVFKEMGNSSLNFELYIWLYGNSVYMPNRTKSCFLKYIYNKLNEVNIIIPFPQQDIYIKQLPEIKIKNIKD